MDLLASVAEYAAAVAQAGGPTPDPETRDERQRRIEQEVDSWEKLVTYVDEWRHSGSQARESILTEMVMASS